MIKDLGMPIEFWPEALAAQTYVRNRLPNSPEIKGFKVSPKEAYLGNKLVISYLKVWGC